MVDANFRLKLKAKGIKDDALNEGWAYFVEDKKYKEHIAKYTHQEEVKK